MTSGSARVGERPRLRNSKEPMKRDRLQVRLSSAQKALLQEAAAIEGRSMTDFLLAHAQTSAERVIEAQKMTRVSAEYEQAFVAALVNPPPPNARLREAGQFFDAVMGDR